MMSFIFIKKVKKKTKPISFLLSPPYTPKYFLESIPAYITPYIYNYNKSSNYSANIKLLWLFKYL